MEIEDTLAYIHNMDWRKSKLGLERMSKLLNRMGNPQNKIKFIHVAGTNGKGSTSAMLSSILTQAGYITGLYTSPYIHRFNERIQVSGTPIEDHELCAVTKQIQIIADHMADHPTEFEMITAMAFSYFESKGCDIVVLEVGLGGRLDATNVIPVPELAIITTIDLDHIAELGDTLEKIAAEKAGIIKAGGSVVLYPQHVMVDAVIENACIERKANLTKVNFDNLNIISSSLIGHCFDYDNWKKMQISLLGDYQPMNAATVLTSISILKKKGWKLSDHAVYEGMKLTKWPARFELVHQQPYVIVDGGHNPQCVNSIISSLQCYFPNKSITIIFGVMADKDYSEMLGIIQPFTERAIAVTPDFYRALPAEELAKDMLSAGFVNVTFCSSVEEGLRFALNTAKKEDVICAFGSFYMAGAIRTYFGLC